MKETTEDDCQSCLQFPSHSWINFALQNVAIPVFSILGIIGNILAIIVFRNPRMKSTFNQSLAALAYCDTLFLALVLADSTEHFLLPFYVLIFPYFLNPMKNILLNCETFLIMSISTERFLAVCHPLLYRGHRLRQSCRVHLLTYILPPVLVATLLNIPKFWEMEFVMNNQTDTHRNVTQEVLDFDLAPLKLDPTYIFFYTICTKVVFTGVIPIIYLIILNIFIAISIRKSTKFSPKASVNSKCSARFSQKGSLYSKHSTKFSTKRSVNSEQHVENINQKLPLRLSLKITRKNSKSFTHKAFRMLVAIVVIYIICNIPRLLLNILDYYFLALSSFDFCDCEFNPFWLLMFIIVSHCCLVINSAINFFIYFSVSKMFKKVLMMKLRIFRLRKRESLVDIDYKPNPDVIERPNDLQNMS